MNCVWINHKDSGTMVTGQSHKEIRSNIKEAMQNMVNHPKFKVWHARRVKEVMDKETISEKVDKMMVPGNLKIEQQEDGKWTEYHSSGELSKNI